jgi:hypothetical protein
MKLLILNRSTIAASEITSGGLRSEARSAASRSPKIRFCIGLP